MKLIDFTYANFELINVGEKVRYRFEEWAREFLRGDCCGEGTNS